MERGEIVIECDRKGCRAEDIFGAAALRKRPVIELAHAEGWQHSLSHGWVCPECVESDMRKAEGDGAHP